MSGFPSQLLFIWEQLHCAFNIFTFSKGCFISEASDFESEVSAVSESGGWLQQWSVKAVKISEWVKVQVEVRDELARGVTGRRPRGLGASRKARTSRRRTRTRTSSRRRTRTSRRRRRRCWGWAPRWRGPRCSGTMATLAYPSYPGTLRWLHLWIFWKSCQRFHPIKDERVSQNLYIFHFPVCFSLAFFGLSKIKSVSQSLKSGTCNQLKSWEKISGQFSPIHWQNCWILSPQKTIISQTSLRLKSSDKELDNLLLISMWFIRLIFIRFKVALLHIPHHTSDSLAADVHL